MTAILYNGDIRLDYKDKSHYYGVRERVNYDLPVENLKAWGKSSRPKGTTTLLGDTLEKKGLMTWPMGVALAELFGFYDFDSKDQDGNPLRLTGFSKEKGTLWDDPLAENRTISTFTAEDLLPKVLSASKNYVRKQKKGADIGSVVHDAIEHYINANPNKPEPVVVSKKDGGFEVVVDKDGNAVLELPDIRPSLFDIKENYMWSIKESEYETEADEAQALIDFVPDTNMAQLAFDRFCVWWNTERPELLAAEQLIYSRKHHVSGTFDALIRWKDKVYLVDWKTSKASMSKDAAMPDGINYQYFIQDAIYALGLEEEGSLLEELGVEKVDGLMVVSARKDGGFAAITSEDIGLSTDECKDWAQSVMLSHHYAKTAKGGLWAYNERSKDG